MTPFFRRFASLSLAAAAALVAAMRLGAADGVAFDGAKAYEHLRQLVLIGARPSDSDGVRKARAYIASQMSALGLKAVEQPFTAETPRGPRQMANILVTLPGERPEKIIISGHYDTKFFREFYFVGANDGGSSAAFVIEMARVLKARKNPLTIELAFWDGEEALVDWSNNDHTYGSRRYVEVARASGALKSIKAMILVDMIGDRDLVIKREAASTPWLTDAIWASARTLKATAFVSETVPIEDDHMPFVAAGVPAVDLIDLDYPPWHTEQDTMDHVSARSLQTVGDVLMHALPAIEKRALAAK